MVETIDFPGIQPGVISALLFIFLDIFTVGILDIVLARVVCLVYYRRINEGTPISVKSADIPGLSNYLLGKWMSWINLVAIFTKLALLGVVLTANISIGSKEAATSYVERSATFGLAPSDAHINKNFVYTVRRRYESSKSCFKEEGDKITYYSLRFNLQNNVQLEDDYGTPGVDQPDFYDVNDSTVICMSPEEVRNEEVLMVVKGCTRMNPKNESCLTVVSQREKKAAPIDYDTPDKPYEGEIVHEFRDYDQETINKLFDEYENPRLTCLSTEIGIDSGSDPSRYTHCLLVAYNYSNNPKVENETIVERWILGPDRDGNPERLFIMEYPGIRFSGIFRIERLASARYLQLPFPFTDYRTLSGELIAQASDYEYLGSANKTSRSRAQVGQLVYKDNTVITTITKFAVAMVATSVVLVLVAFVITQLVLWRDKRPRFNTINGLSSIVREEHVPSGRSYNEGASAILGLHFTSEDKLHFGPLSSNDESQPFQEGYDTS